MPVGFHDGLTAEQTFAARIGLVIYSGAAGALVTVHQIAGDEKDYTGEGELMLLAGQPLTQEMAAELARGLLGTAPTRTVLPPNVLTWDGQRLAWWVPSARRRIWFDPRQQPKLQHVSRELVLHPPLVMVADPGRLHVYALAENERPGPDTPLYQAPYLNVYGDGSVCAGGVQLPRNTDVTDIAAWELVWFDSEGTHAATPRLTLYPGGQAALWEAMLTADRFPSESLVPLGITLFDAINREGPSAIGPDVREEIVPAQEAA